jgi:hypothetical protein
MIDEALKPLRLALDHVLESATDPWENIRSTSTEAIKAATSPHLNDVCKFYNISKKVCMVLGKITHAEIICSHIWPAHTLGRGLQSFKLQQEDVNNPRNFLRLHKDIECAFDHKRLYFEYVSGPSPLILRVVLLDPNLHSENIRFNNGATKPFSEIHNQLLSHQFLDDKKPFLRLLSVHAYQAITKARNQNWIPDPSDMTSRIARNLELARLSLEPNHGEVMKAFFNHL